MKPLRSGDIGAWNDEGNIFITHDYVTLLCRHCGRRTRHDRLPGPCPECAGLLEPREVSSRWTNGAAWVCNHCGTQVLNTSARKVVMPPLQDLAHRLEGRPVDLLDLLSSEIEKFQLYGVCYSELQQHLARLYEGPELLRPKNLRTLLELAIGAGLITCRDGRYFRTFTTERGEK